MEIRGTCIVIFECCLAKHVSLFNFRGSIKGISVNQTNGKRFDWLMIFNWLFDITRPLPVIFRNTTFSIEVNISSIGLNIGMV